MQCKRYNKIPLISNCKTKELVNVGGVPVGRKLFEEVDKPTASNVVFEDKDRGVIERESTWNGDIKGYNSFPSGKLMAQVAHIFIIMAA